MVPKFNLISNLDPRACDANPDLVRYNMAAAIVFAWNVLGTLALQVPANMCISPSIGGVARCSQLLAASDADEEAYRRGWKKRPEGAALPLETETDDRTGVTYRTLGSTEVALRGGKKKKLNTELDHTSARCVHQIRAVCSFALTALFCAHHPCALRLPSVQRHL